MNVRAVPKGVVLQVRNVLTNLVDISGRPGVPLLDLLLDKAADPGDRARLTEIRDVLADPGGSAGCAAARGDRGGRLRRAPAAGGVPVLLAEHLRVPPGGAAAAAALLLGELEPAGARRGRRPGDRRARGHAGAGRAPVPRHGLALPARAAPRRPAERLPGQRRRIPPAAGRDQADDLRLGRHRAGPDAGVPLGAAGDAARGRHAGGGGAVQRHPFGRPGLHLPGRDRAVRGRGGAQPRARRDVAGAAGPPRIRAGPDPRAGRAGLAAARGRAGTSTSAGRSRCATRSAPPSPTSSRTTEGCRATAPRPTSTSWRRPHATAPTSGADPWEPPWMPSPLS